MTGTLNESSFPCSPKSQFFSGDGSLLADSEILVLRLNDDHGVNYCWNDSCSRNEHLSKGYVQFVCCCFYVSCFHCGWR